MRGIRRPVSIWSASGLAGVVGVLVVLYGLTALQETGWGGGGFGGSATKTGAATLADDPGVRARLEALREPVYRRWLAVSGPLWIATGGLFFVAMARLWRGRPGAWRWAAGAVVPAVALQIGVAVMDGAYWYPRLLAAGGRADVHPDRLRLLHLVAGFVWVGGFLAIAGSGSARRYCRRHAARRATPPG